MPRAEAGSTKSVANKMKAAGLGRLRWYCQACEKQMRDENGFKCHVASETHVRKMQSIGEDPRKAINDYSAQFLRDFLQLLRTAHGEKKVHMNHFYQEYIHDKHHVHMNATKWNSLTEFGKYLGREGICRVYDDDEDDKGLFISWIDNSPEALRRQEAVKRKERQDKGDEEREQRQIREQIERANERREAEAGAEPDATRELVREEGKRISLNFVPAKKPATTVETSTAEAAKQQQQQPSPGSTSSDSTKENQTAHTEPGVITTTTKPTLPSSANPLKMFLKAGPPGKPKNVFATARGEKRREPMRDAPKMPMSNAQRIMMEEQAKRRRVF